MPGKCTRGEVIRINLDPAVGSEPKKTRPCLVIQNDIGNKYSPVTIVAVITGAENVPRRYPVDVPIRKGEAGLEKDSVIQCNLIRSVDESRIGPTLGHVTSTTMQKVEQALRISLGLEPNFRTPEGGLREG
jgi:mRNA interferase MazF